jgi:hypothetical protein
MEYDSWARAPVLEAGPLHSAETKRLGRCFRRRRSVTPLVLLSLKLKHNIVSIGISCVCHT